MFDLELPQSYSVAPSCSIIFLSLMFLVQALGSVTQSEMAKLPRVETTTLRYLPQGRKSVGP
jgi:hypothetical protein